MRRWSQPITHSTTKNILLQENHGKQRVRQDAAVTSSFQVTGEDVFDPILI